jgi:hypothetical protein
MKQYFEFQYILFMYGHGDICNDKKMIDVMMIRSKNNIYIVKKVKKTSLINLLKARN